MPETPSPLWQDAFFAACPDMMLRQGMDGTIIECKPGRDHEPLAPVEALVGRQFGDFLPEEEANRAADNRRRAIETGEIATVEIAVAGDGVARAFELRCVPYAPDETVTIIREITRRRIAEAQLLDRDRVLERLIRASTRINAERTLERVLQEIADSAREVIRCRYAALGVLNPQGDALDNFVVSAVTDETMARIGSLPTGKGVLGLLIREPKPIRIRDLGAHDQAHGFPAHHPPMHSFLGVPVLTGDNVVGNLYFTEKIDGPAFTEEDEAVAVMFAANAAVAVRNARLDEEAVRLLHDLQLLQRNRDRFYAMVNHELRNALTAVYGWSELLMRKAGSTPSRPLRETVESAQHALDLLNDLLDLSRLDAEMLEVRPGTVTTESLAREAVNAIQPAAEGAGVHIDITDEVAGEFQTDAKRVRQILINLLSNAVRHSPEGATVTVEVGGTAEIIEFRIIDRGNGIGPQELAIIFDAYARAETTTGGGTGLGLTLSRRLARLLGGELSVQSQIDEGSTFCLHLPRRRS